jgi:hypothetical protein
MPAINVAAKLVRKKKEKKEIKSVQMSRVDSTPEMLNLWCELTANWFLSVMRPHNGHQSQIVFKTFWTKVPFKESVQAFYTACVMQKGKGGLTEIKTSMLDAYEKWEDKELLGKMFSNSSDAIQYRLAREVCGESHAPQAVDFQSRRHLRNALEFCKGIVADQPKAKLDPPRRRRETYSHALEKHPYKHVSWLNFPVKSVVVAGDHPLYSSHEKYEGQWYRPNSLFFKDILVKQRRFGHLGDEPLHLGFVNLESKVVPETLDMFRQEMKTRNDGHHAPIQMNYTPAQVYAAARPFLYSFGLSRTKVGTIDEAVAVLTEASVGHEQKNKADVEDRVRASSSYYRGVLHHILQEGSQRKPTRPLGFVKKKTVPVYKDDPVQNVCDQFQSCTLKAFHEAKQLHPEPFSTSLQVKSLADMMTKLRLQSLQVRQDLCASCSQPCYASKGSLKTVDEGTVKTFCSELCYTTKTAH